MSVRIRKYKTGGFEVDIRVMLPDGSRLRERRKSPVDSRSGSRRWGELRARELIQNGTTRPRKEVPTLEQFWPRFIDGHCRANKHKPSGMAGKQAVFRNHLGPMFARKRLDQFVQEDVAQLKRRLVDHKASTTNNVLTTWNTLLRVAVEWGVIDKMPVRIRLLKLQKPPVKFYDFDEYQWLLEAAEKIDPRAKLSILLAGDAGLRRGEIIALEQSDCDLRRGQITVERSSWNGQVTETKGMEYRVVPMTQRLHAALRANRHMRGDRVLYTDAGEPASAKVIQKWVMPAQRRANLKATGGIHILRHTFCSHLAMKGVTALSIQKLAGHKNMQTTLRYMHLAPGETHRAIRILEGSERPQTASELGDMWETAVIPIRKLNEDK